MTLKIAIIAAMEREVAPLIRNWKMRKIEYSGRSYRLFESAFKNGDTVLICGGIGAEAARRATEAVIREANPQRIVSTGFAGALNGALQAGDIVEPAMVINGADGVRTEVGSGKGILVTSATVADKEQKARFSKAYGADAVDMEAGAVAQGAQARGVEFAALKAISDAADFSLPALDSFVTNDGSFRSARFAGYVALRPWLWSNTIALARNSSKASHALSRALGDYLDRETLGQEAPADASLPSELNPIKVGLEFAGAHTGTGYKAHTQVEGKQQGSK
jgi:adenosylhomocysteine nucleosidase